MKKLIFRNYRGFDNIEFEYIPASKCYCKHGRVKRLGMNEAKGRSSCGAQVFRRMDGVKKFTYQNKLFYFNDAVIVEE